MITIILIIRGKRKNTKEWNEWMNEWLNNNKSVIYCKLLMPGYPPSHYPVEIVTFSSKMRRTGYFFVQNASKWSLFRPKCVEMVIVSTQMRRNCNLFVKNASKLLLFRPRCVEIVFFCQKCVEMVTFSSEMRRNCHFFVRNAPKW